MRQILTDILWFAILLGTAACRKDGPSSLEGTIGFGVVQAETRTTAFESDDDLLALQNKLKASKGTKA